ncbi:FkbM family methyltransferase [Ketobacter sp. MCCC 1A13808]|uniref:FkbM family methyltransferase n=1 Tax=Ketobacter sp. MCCC 1A13808 TaxID=2602738 RepID=UPI0012EBE7F5|nr:FkbM family methyltransferase [Ketobacter sp. MCCC 1A13808]MVF12929.1 FkbM family methyltransferase [Ketobacter sp. MCCC 1A13808]
MIKPNTIKKYIKPIVELSPMAATSYRYFRDLSLLAKDSRITPFGFKFTGNEMMINGQFEPDETALIRSLFSEARLFINIGANIGYYCCMARKFNVPVVAFEPIYMNVQLLLKNIKDNNYEDEFVLFPIALSDKRGIVEIYGAGTGASIVQGWAGNSKASPQLAPSSTIDAILTNKFELDNALILIDVEGAEYFVLKGAEELLNSRSRPIWIIEIAIDEHQPGGASINKYLMKTFEILWSSGYESWTVCSEPKKVTRAMIENIINSGVNNLSTHNFLFKSAENQCVINDIKQSI